jgi:protein SCO1/2
MSRRTRHGAWSRRAWLLCAAALAQPWRAAAHATLGPVEPRRPAPPLPLTLHDGRSVRLDEWLRGHLSAVQLVFTGCSSVCPIQAAVFAALQRHFEQAAPAPARARLLSISIDPLGDDAPALKTWLQRHGAGPRWAAAVPAVRHAEVMLDFLAGRPANGKVADRHTAQVYLFDAQGRLAFRCAELASPADIAKAMVELARIG